MNKILLNSEISNYEDDDILIYNNSIIFKKSGNYEIEYQNITDINYLFEINNCIVNLTEICLDNNIVVNNKYNVVNGKLDVNKFYNNDTIRESIDLVLNNDGDVINYNFANICRNDEMYKINIIHKNKNTISNINNKSVCLRNSNLLFDINSIVSKECLKSKLNQNTRIITLGDCKTKINPNMFIDLDDVEARHGSVIGTFKDDQLFYLMSKGISYNDSLKLLIKGYLLSNIKVSSEIRFKIIDIIDSYWR